MPAIGVPTKVLHSSSQSPVEGAAIQELTEAALCKRIQRLGPWKMNIQLTPLMSTENGGSTVGGPGNPSCKPDGHAGSFLRNKFLGLIDALYPTGLQNESFLDCGCNAGAYCFWARERNVQRAYGFDVREQWIKQAKFVQNHRTVAPTDRIRFEVRDIRDIGHDRQRYDLVLFRGLFQHLADPIGGLKVAADATTDILIFSTVFRLGKDDNSLKLRPRTAKKSECGGVEGLSWLPSGPGACIALLKQFGFQQVKMVGRRPIKSDRRPGQMGRMELVAARDEVRLDAI